MNIERIQRRMTEDRRALNRMAESDRRGLRATDRVLCALGGALLVCILLLIAGY